MPEDVKLLRVVLASPSDVPAERDACDLAVQEANRKLSRRGHPRVLLQLLRWETDARPGFDPDGPQGLLDPILDIKNSDIFVGVFWKRLGTVMRTGETGTEHEFNAAYSNWQTHKRPHIMVYFNKKKFEPPDSQDEVDQMQRVLNFRKRFPGEGLYWEYSRKAQFVDLVRDHLDGVIEFERNKLVQAEKTSRAIISADWHGEQAARYVKVGHLIAAAASESTLAIQSREFCELKSRLGPNLGSTLVSHLMQGDLTSAENHLHRSCALHTTEVEHLLRVGQEALRYRMQSKGSKVAAGDRTKPR